MTVFVLFWSVAIIALLFNEWHAGYHSLSIRSSLTNIHGGRYRPKSTYDIYLQKTILVNSSETYRSIILKVMHEKWSAKLLQDALNVEKVNEFPKTKRRKHPQYRVSKKKVPSDQIWHYCTKSWDKWNPFSVYWSWCTCRFAVQK